MGLAVVAGSAVEGPGQELQAAKEHQRLGDAIASDAYAMQVAHEFLDRVGDRVSVCVAAGPLARDTAEIAHSRQCVNRILRVLRETPRGRRVARLEDVRAESLMLELRDLVRTRGEASTGPIARLTAHDEARGTVLVETLGAWLDAFGDVRSASEGPYVRPPQHRPLPPPPDHRDRRDRPRRPRGAARRDAPAAARAA